MRRGTTPTLEFTLPFDVETLADGWVTFSQDGKVILDKNLSDCDCDCDENRLILKLTQEDTLALEHDKLTEIQLRVKTHAGEALASQIITVNTLRILKDGEI